jgi:hypothetical protein
MAMHGLLVIQRQAQRKDKARSKIKAKNQRAEIRQTQDKIRMTR